MIGPLPDPTAVFEALRADTDAERASERLTALVRDVVGIVHRDVQDIVVDDATWGSGVYAGEFGSGDRIRVWQAGVDINDFTTKTRAKVDGLFRRALSAAGSWGYQIKWWTLALPAELGVPDLKRWHAWARATKKETGVTIVLWTASTIRRHLLSREGETIRREHLSSILAAAPRTVQELDDEAKYENTLFVRQLKEAKVSETGPAKAAFFNAEILNREVSDKSVPAEQELLREWRMQVHATWADVFNEACLASDENVLPGVVKAVSDLIHEDRADYSARMRASTIHGVGIMHQTVEAGRAGWVRDWRSVVTTHNEERTTSPLGVAATGGTSGSA
ncbi:hypothetical protein O1W71_13475 [Microbacterium sp. H37-C3]|uniref:hypothetical protein n=1 Tax=Microbacterium sp. H37-C3 TaxID=3004354 RepID=UPI0022AF2382|nr:hypothetical protein [Microbacterium sp. H37-C3]MCZ4068684.1 hypothetical protein [Microbacterium sp. H37-C3]